MKTLLTLLTILLFFTTITHAQHLLYKDKNNITISHVTAQSIKFYNCTNVRIQDSRIINGEGIYFYGCSNITLKDNLFKTTEYGVRASRSTGLYIYRNQFLNMQGPPNSGQFVQFIECYGKGNKITQNRMENLPGKSNPEDAINIYKSSGTADSPIEVSYNWIRGGGPSNTGGGIVLGDGQKKTATQPAICGSYQTAFENILVNPGQYAIAIVGGHHMSLKNNIVYGKAQSFTNVGMPIWNPYNDTMHHIEATGNRINFTSGKGYQNAMWDDLKIGAYKNNYVDLKLTSAILPKVLITKK